MIKKRIAEEIRNSLQRAVENKQLGQLTKLNDKISNGIIIERTKNPEYGDYSCNVSYLARESKMSPLKIAEAIKENSDADLIKYYSLSVMAGFINFKLTPAWLNQATVDILEQQDDYGRCNSGNNLKVNLEYVSANPTGPLHIGHGRWAALGSCIENIMKFAGYDVDTEFYINDAGVQIKNLGHSLFLRLMQEFDADTYFPYDKEQDSRAANFYPGDYLKDMAKMYIKQTSVTIDDLKKQSTIEDKLYVPDEELRIKLSNFAKVIIRQEQEDLLAGFRTTFKTWYSETELHESGKVSKILDYLEEKGVLYDKDDATWFASSKALDDQDRVVRKSDGSLTYLTADIAYHKDKYDRGYDHLINIWGADHHGYVPRMKSAVQALGKSPDSLEILLGQMVNLIVDGEQMRMGKRKKMYTLEDLINEVGVDATRFWMVSRTIDTTLDFDVNLAKSASDENPVFYVQYAHARCCSILRIAISEREDTDNKQILSPLYTSEELDQVINKIKSNSELLTCLWDDSIDQKQALVSKTLILYLETFKDVVLRSSRDRAPNIIARYLIDLASCYHSFYAECRVLNLNPAYEMPKELQDARLALIHATRQILYNGLRLLGVNAPESM